MYSALSRQKFLEVSCLFYTSTGNFVGNFSTDICVENFSSSLARSCCTK